MTHQNISRTAYEVSPESRARGQILPLIYHSTVCHDFYKWFAITTTLSLKIFATSSCRYSWLRPATTVPKCWVFRTTSLQSDYHLDIESNCIEKNEH